MIYWRARTEGMKQQTMTRFEIASQRMLNQHIALPTYTRAVDVVAWLGAVQAQDYAGAKWALGLRLQGATDGSVEQAFNDGVILRTHLMRPTWHFVTPADIRWMLSLTAPRVHVANAYMYRKLELDNAVFKRSNAVLAKALQGGKHLTRDELREVLQRAHIATDGAFRMGYIMMRAELDGVVCSGARRGNQFTYALLEERAPDSKATIHERDEALAELARRYFSSRGPATVQDYAKWSGLTLADARKGLEESKAQLEQEVVGGQVHWFSTSNRVPTGVSSSAYLLSIYDEYVSGYKDRSALGDEAHAARLRAMGNALNYIIVIDGQIKGTWKRTLKKDAVVIESNAFMRLTRDENRAVAAAALQYGAFLGLPVILA
jgi:hypothetical protein